MIVAALVLQTPVVLPESLALQGDAAYGTVERVVVEGRPFRTAFRVSTKRVAPDDWRFEVGTDVVEPVKKGDVMLASVWARAIKGQPETGEGRAVLDFQTKEPDWSKSVSFPFAITKDWRRIDVPFTAGYDTPAGGANVAFRLGGLVQTVELGGLSIKDYGPDYDLSKLPRTEIHYAGEEAGAPWRKAALRRIDQIRKGPLTVRVLGAKGRPVYGARVQVRMTRSAFAFGTAVAAEELLKTGPDAERYRKTLLADFNRATVENALKWPYAETWGRESGPKAVDWLVAHGLTVRAHNLIWSSWRNSPPDLEGLSEEALKRRIDDRIQTAMTLYRGKVAVWDVVNEPFDNHDVFDKLGVAPVPEMATWFRKAHRIDPKPTLVLNDYPPLDGGAKDNPHLESLYRNLAGLKAAGAPIGGIGFQCHIGGDPIPPARVLSGLDRFAKLGLPIEITEFDINSGDRPFQARYMRDFLIAAFSHPSVTGFTQWGFWTNRHWLPDGALYGPDWSLRPHGKAYLDLVNHAWRTNVVGRTAKNGEFRVRGFLGDYEVTVNGRKAKVTLFKEGRTLIVGV